MAVTDSTSARRRPSRMLVTVIVLTAACTALAVTVAVLVLRPSDRAPAAAPSVPVIENIPRPNPACTPAADRKLGSDDDLTKIQWFGWLDGKYADMPVGQALMLRLRGHDLRDAWYCPPRADW